jgi:hypothetical protein
MKKKYGIKNKSAKQCRERWINFHCPNIKKGIWSEKEEKILFLNQLKIGNKWTELSKLIPNRSENDIKNHFYSKLRKYIRKIYKYINQNNILESYGIDRCLYNANTIYSLIQKNNIPLNILNKNTIVQIIQNDYEKKEKLNESNKTELKISYSNSENSFDTFKINEINNEEQFFGDFFFDDLSKIDIDEISSNIFDNEDDDIFLLKKKKGVNIFQ